MSENAIVVENLAKCYLIGHQFSFSRGGPKYTLRDVLRRELGNFKRKASDVLRGRQVVQGHEIEEFWALRNVSFEVKQGEVIGIIGRNGAGKSTLLKVLSRITEPTEGRLWLRGRVSSLLEVGTGFHPELTGRENVFLNGAILGMTQREIQKKFDEIVAFSEIEKFLDTPVKHYSSGMYIRLAFAVAAHLEPDILVVDEVLAVGDAEFQKKCIGKMDEVSRKQGRTVLFVSHNMEAILKLCGRAIFLESGSIREMGEAKSVVLSYLRSNSASPRVIVLLRQARTERFLDGKARLVRASPSDTAATWSIPFGQQISLDLCVDVKSPVTQIEILIAVFSVRGFEVATWTNRCSDVQLSVRPGISNYRIQFEDLLLLPGQYSLGIGLECGRGFEDWIRDAVQFEVISSPEVAAINAGGFQGALVPAAAVFTLD